MKGVEWKDDDLKLFATKTDKEIAKITGRTLHGVAQKRRNYWYPLHPEQRKHRVKYKPEPRKIDPRGNAEPTAEEWAEHLKSLPKWKGCHRVRMSLIEEHENKLTTAA